MQIEFGHNLSIVIPAYNEEETIGKLLEILIKIIEQKSWEIIVVDDGSTDRTAEIAESYVVRVIKQENNRGYGAALKAGVRSASSDKLFFIDADGQHSPEYIEKLAAHLDEYHMVIGSRPNSANKLSRLPGKWVISKVANFLSGTKIPDINSGFRAVRKENIKSFLHTCPDGFSFSTTSTMLFLTGGYKVKWVPIEVNMRQGGKSSVSQIKDGLNTILLILRCIVLFNVI